MEEWAVNHLKNMVIAQFLCQAVWTFLAMCKETLHMEEMQHKRSVSQLLWANRYEGQVVFNELSG